MRPMKLGDLKISVPIIQGGMGIGVSLSKLASAVANMGGVGIISSVGIGLTGKQTNQSYKKSNIDAIRNEIRKAREMTSGVLGVNIMSVLTNFSDMVKTSIEEGIDIIFSGAGLPLDLPSYLGKGVKTKLVPIVSSGRAASIIAQKWKQNYDYLPDAFVVEGPKAGGHLGFKADALQEVSNKLENLVDEVLKVARDIKEKFNIEIPVIAAGGIFTGKDIFQIMNRGASAVQMGTRFVATEECDASDEFKQAYLQAEKDDITLIRSPVGLPGRALSTPFVKQMLAKEDLKSKKCEFKCLKKCDHFYCISDRLMKAHDGNVEEGLVFSGENVYKMKEILTVRQVFDQFTSQAESVYKEPVTSPYY